MSDDEMLREALLEIAGRAHDPAPLAGEIAARARLHRQRRGLLVAAAAVGTAAAGGAGVAAWPRREPGVVLVPPAIPAPPQSPTGTKVALSYRPAWLPPGFAEVSRTATVPGTGPVAQVRTWRRGADPDDLVQLFLQPRSRVDLTGTSPATIGGRRAWRSPSRIWLDVGGDLLAGVAMIRPGDRDRVAASIEPEPSAVCEVSLVLGWVPDRFTGAVGTAVSGTAGQWSETLRLDGRPGGPTAIEAELVWEVSTSKGSPVTLRGLPGMLLIAEPGATSGCPDLPGRAQGCGGPPTFARVELSGSRLLRVTIGSEYAVTRDELIRIVEGLVLGPGPDVAWLPA